MKRATRNKALVVTLIAVVVAAIVGVVVLVRSHYFDVGSSTLSDNTFTVSYPKDWKSVPPLSVAGASQDLAVLKQKSGLGLVAFTRGGSASHLTGSFLINLENELRASTPDYKAVSWRIITVGSPSTQALFVTYLRTKKLEVHTVTVIPAGDHSFVIATAASERDPQISKEVGQIITSVTLKN